MICPCKDCSDRYPSCHSKCEQYINWKDIHNEEQQRLRDLKFQEYDLYGARRYAIERIIKRSKR